MGEVLRGHRVRFLFMCVSDMAGRSTLKSANAKKKYHCKGRARSPDTGGAARAQVVGPPPEGNLKGDDEMTGTEAKEKLLALVVVASDESVGRFADQLAAMLTARQVERGLADGQGLGGHVIGQPVEPSIKPDAVFCDRVLAVQDPDGDLQYIADA